MNEPESQMMTAEEFIRPGRLISVNKLNQELDMATAIIRDLIAERDEAIRLGNQLSDGAKRALKQAGKETPSEGFLTHHGKLNLFACIHDLYLERNLAKAKVCDAERERDEERAACAEMREALEHAVTRNPRGQFYYCVRCGGTVERGKKAPIAGATNNEGIAGLEFESMNLAARDGEGKDG